MTKIDHTKLLKLYNITRVILAIMTIILLYLLVCHIIDEYIWYNCLEGKSIASLYAWVYRNTYGRIYYLFN